MWCCSQVAPQIALNRLRQGRTSDCTQQADSGAAYLQISVGGNNATFATTDLFNSIQNGDYPGWTFKVQLMDPADEVRPCPLFFCLASRTC